jgi:hypothetical protein
MVTGIVKIKCDECGNVLEEIEDVIPDDVSSDDTSKSSYYTLCDGFSIASRGKSYDVGYSDEKHFCNEMCLAATLKKFFALEEVKPVEVKKDGDKKRK